MRIIIMITVAILAGCATVPILVPIDYRYLDQPDLEGIELKYTNSSRRLMCLSQDQWPSKSGLIDQASDLMFLIVDGNRYQIKDTNMGYCIGGCPTYVAPGEEVKAFIPYSKFDLPLTQAK